MRLARRPAARCCRHHHRPKTSSPSVFSSYLPAAPLRVWSYMKIEICQWYWETEMPLPWTYVNLPNNWHLSADEVPVLPVPVSVCALLEETNRRRRTSSTLPGTPWIPHSGTCGSGMSTTCVAILFCREYFKPAMGALFQPRVCSEPVPVMGGCMA